MRLAIFSTVICFATFGFTHGQDVLPETPMLSNGMIGLVCSASLVDIDANQMVELEIPLPDQQRTKTIHYTEPVPNGQRRTKTVHYWTFAVKTRSIAIDDLIAYHLDGTKVDPDTVRKRLRKKSQVLLGYLPSEDTRSILRKDTIVLIPKKGVRIEGFEPIPY